MKISFKRQLLQCNQLCYKNWMNPNKECSVDVKKYGQTHQSHPLFTQRSEPRVIHSPGLVWPQANKQ